MQIESISHITFMVRDVERMAVLMCQGLGAVEVYDSLQKNYSLSREKFFVLGNTWIVVMQGDSPSSRSYNHTAFSVSSGALAVFEERLRALGVEIKPARTRVQGEGESLYFYDFDHHLFELHSGTLARRLECYET